MRSKRILFSTSRRTDPFLGDLIPSQSFTRDFADFLRNRRLTLILAASSAALGLAGCAQQPQQRMAAAARSKEYFPSSVYGKASPRVIADGQPVPRGGGTYLVGKPYTVAGHTYYPSEKHTTKVGLASWYGDAFHGRRTANGEIYDRDAVTAASPTLPLPSYARVTNLRNHYSMVVRVNDRGPFASDRIMDVSHTVAQALDFHRTGTAKIKVEYLSPASLNGSDDKILLATLRQDGRPASLGQEAPVMTAQNAEPLRTASTAPLATPISATQPVAPQPQPVQPSIPKPVPAVRLQPMDTPTPAPVASPSSLANSYAPKSPSKADSQALAALAAASLAKPMVKPGKAFGVTVEERPLPPSRPFDLSTIPGAGVPIGASSRSASLR
ncbi:septal ring lytic transglycosylase RlpA family protein [Beijerinckia indica]|uniref:Endolytic peptidoglycan transglycosylase RlpA n=1 Tax=Beijerinckia indica subsp. indica (strain ATCC 9039 / DSM 1715 / NCIMB 8712) TaxID=395963 RepID=B2IB87_BEII9|nr:septal ring lytic transglycosylase RlpA family protein [Beijerinckia indica]ACB95171.1 rare lipoprotein A [Beijerinckia indica subsp. indica ATCC 9039]